MEKLYKKGLFLEYFTVGYNVAEAVVSVVFGYIANSIALIGFGLDSVVESLSGMVLIWRLRQHGKISERKEEEVEKKATKFVAITFFVLGFYVLFPICEEINHKRNSGSLPAWDNYRHRLYGDHAVFISAEIQCRKTNPKPGLGFGFQRNISLLFSVCRTFIGIGIELCDGILAGRSDRGYDHRRFLVS